MQAAAAVELASLAAGLPDEPLSDSPSLAEKYSYALVQARKGHLDSAVDLLLEVLKADRRWESGKAKQTLLQIFSALQGDERVAKWRAQLSNILF